MEEEDEDVIVWKHKGSRFRVHLVSPYFSVGHLIFAVCFSYFIPIARPCFFDSGETTLKGIVHCHLIDYHQ